MLIIDHEYRGVRAFHYIKRKAYRILYLRASDMKLIGDMPIKGISEQWTIRTIEHSIDRLFDDMEEHYSETKNRTPRGVQEIQNGIARGNAPETESALFH